MICNEWWITLAQQSGIDIFDGDCGSQIVVSGYPTVLSHCGYLGKGRLWGFENKTDRDVQAIVEYYSISSRTSDFSVIKFAPGELKAYGCDFYETAVEDRPYRTIAHTVFYKKDLWPLPSPASIDDVKAYLLLKVHNGQVTLLNRCAWKDISFSFRTNSQTSSRPFLLHRIGQMSICPVREIASLEVWANWQGVLISPFGEKLGNGLEHIAEEKISPALSIIYRRTPNDIGILVERFRLAPVQTQDRLDTKFWMNSSCTLVDGACSGNCTSGSCQWVSNGNFSYCDCV